MMMSLGVDRVMAVTSTGELWNWGDNHWPGAPPTLMQCTSDSLTIIGNIYNDII